MRLRAPYYISVLATVLTIAAAGVQLSIFLGAAQKLTARTGLVGSIGWALPIWCATCPLLIIASCVGQSKWRHFQKKPSRLQDFDTFDEASRGPSGALKLLWRLRARFGTPVIAALVTIIALGVDSFAQQVVKLDQQNEMVEVGNATFWVTDIYNGGGLARPMVGRNSIEGIHISQAYHNPMTALTRPF